MHSVVRHKNWMTKTFPLKRGVCQGCPLLCHLFNLVGQVLVFSLHEAGCFSWWHHLGDPCSIYADDNALFVLNLDQLPEILEHILKTGEFTGLKLNLNKTIAFSHKVTTKSCVAGVEIGNEPIKYLGAYLGTGDLAALNFEKPLCTARIKLCNWSSQSLALQARVLALKTFVFSLFVHILNMVWVNNDQLDLLQKIMNEFLWKGRNKIYQAVSCAPVFMGGLT